jgi:hypothetical protein
VTPRAIDRLNIGLMLLALGVALVVPFELFLFAYAVLGPLHYLTEIGWLSERQFFTRGRRDGWVILLLLGLMVIGQPDVMGGYAVGALTSHGYRLIFLAFALAGVFAFVQPGLRRNAVVVAAVALAFVLGDGNSRGLLLFALFVTTFVHVCVFTWAFMLQGALRSRSRIGLIACAVFLVCCGLAVVLPPTAISQASRYVAESYRPFARINAELARVFGFGSGGAEGAWAPFGSYRELMLSPRGVAVMRLLAFGYTYHYLNWFSKTSIIRWHRVQPVKLGLAGAVWLASLALYAKDYELGARWLLTLSLAHVLLEFPLNHLSFAAIGRAAVGASAPARP